jgi:hypothetical protein
MEEFLLLFSPKFLIKNMTITQGKLSRYLDHSIQQGEDYKDEFYKT